MARSKALVFSCYLHPWIGEYMLLLNCEKFREFCAEKNCREKITCDIFHFYMCIMSDRKIFISASVGNIFEICHFFSKENIRPCVIIINILVFNFYTRLLSICNLRVYMNNDCEIQLINILLEIG